MWRMESCVEMLTGMDSSRRAVIKVTLVKSRRGRFVAS